MYKRALLVSAIMIASLALSLLSVTPTTADSGSNDDFASAEYIEPGPFSGNLDGASDLEDYYKFNITAGVRIYISFTCSSNAFDLILYDDGESRLAGVDGSSSGVNYLSYMTSAETTFTFCYLLAETDSEASSYSIETFTLTHQNDGGKGADAPESLTGAILIPEGTISGEVDSGKPDDNFKGEDDMDVYKFWAGMGDRINITFITTALDHIYLNLREPDENYIFQDLAVKIGMTAYGEWWTANETEMGYYFIEVYQDTTPGPYTITLDIQRQNDANSGEDAKADFQFSSIVGNGDIYGHLQDEDSMDTYKVRAGNGDVIDLSFRSYSVGDYIYIDLLGSDGSVLVSNRSWSTDSGQMFQYYTANETAVGDFFLKVWKDTAPGDYVMTLQVQKQNDAGSWTDAPETIPTNIVLSPGGFEGWIFDLDTADMYKVPLVSGDVLDITLGVSYGSYVSMVLMNRTMYTLAARSILFGSYVNIRYCVDAIVDNTTTYLKVFGGSARYSLGITISGQNDAGQGGDAGGIVEMGMISTDPFIVQSGTFSGYMHSGDTGDSYSVDLEDNKRLNITVQPEATLMVGVFLHNSTGSVMASEIGTLGSNVTMVYDAEEGGMMQFVLGSYGFFGNYSVTVTITDVTPGDSTPSAPVLTASSGPGKVTLTWTAPADDGGSPITGYKIYKKESGSLEQAALLKTVGPGVLTYEDSYVLLGKTYQYHVTAVNAIGEGASSNMVLGSPTQSSTDSDDDGMPDDWEVLYDLNRFDPTDGTKDKDNDGYSNLEEFLAGTDPTDKDSKPSSLDTDNDGIPDWWELRYELNPGDSADALLDPDNDGRTNIKEYQDRTDPYEKDGEVVDDDDDDDEMMMTMMTMMMTMV